MFHVVLYQPEIPPNTGNIIRLCANTGCSLHLIHPLGFYLNDAHLRRAGLDYHEAAQVQEHDDFDAFLSRIRPPRVFAFSTRAGASCFATDFKTGDAFVFGPETRGLPTHMLDRFPCERQLRIPMRPNNRSINLSNSVAVVCYEAWRQCAFEGADL
ncbi:MAG: tRNA (uridine(34)/cytosine(34)/5-carboxymethylaminomethyluridine(34)-2'-O)-methyltransferase TrmL [Ectothiorhodospiraceae bacterium AqS1]|nr:tRNA (uridine(34)/cytosine(34)/5-carboxymethylaminomethyluridine(34)-2'-O)-methyltransferase TrmL [Ectothiorhodospiraceae bacterium AqS1]